MTATWVVAGAAAKERAVADPFPPVPERQAGYAELSRRVSERGDFDEGSKTISGID